MKAGSAQHKKLGQIASNIEGNYLERWAAALSPRPTPFDAEKVARAIAEHLFDHGFDTRYLHRWLSYHVKYNPAELTTSDLIETAAEIRNEPLTEFEIVAGVSPLPGSKRPENWMKVRELRKWAEREGYSLSNIRVGGGIKFKVASTDKWSAPSLPTSRETRMIRELLNPEGVIGARDVVDQPRRSRRPRNGASRRREK
jgi:hypothetical protein